MTGVFLPNTTFPLRTNFSETEERMLENWSGLYRERLEQSGDPFVIHDGPPYANGNIHIGHALNKVLKDFVVRTQYMLGHSVTFTPGWDCHGLPIEWEVEKQFREEGLDKNADPAAFREACRAYARNWVEVQSAQFQRLGVLADWEHPYLTMNFETEGEIVSAFHELVDRDLVYSARRPVLWSSAERTALAEAETEEKEHQVPGAWVLFQLDDPENVVGAGYQYLEGYKYHMLVWTTTPWSLPGNVALAVNPMLDYSVYTLHGKQVIMANFAAHNFPQARHSRDIIVDKLTVCNAVNPLYPDQKVPIMFADYVSEGKGSGVVHVGPASSIEDWRFAVAHDLPIPDFIGPDGRYVDDLPRFGGVQVVRGKGFGDANQVILDALTESELLMRVDTITLTLKHSWRSGGLLIENATPQWFVRIGSEAKTGFESVEFTPENSRNRFASMMASRGDWLVSRQRMWGAPLAIFVNNKGEILRDPSVNERVVTAIRTHGAQAWFDTDFGVGPEWTKVTDILDVWFDSGCVHRFHQHEVADLYLEGSDQHRGWMQSSFLVSKLTKNQTPFSHLLTHGFVLDAQGMKMSKSKKNVIDPQTVVQTHGADVLRLWVSLTDYTSDVRVGAQSIQSAQEVYKKLRNTVRYLLGALGDYQPSGQPAESLLARYVLDQLDITAARCKAAAKDYNFTRYINAVHEFCIQTLSSLYFDVMRDSLYCDRLDHPTRVEYLDVLSKVFDAIVVLLAPIAPFMAEEAWQTRYPNAQSVHLKRLNVHPEMWTPKDSEQMKSYLNLRETIFGMIERGRDAGEFKGNAEVVIMGKLPDGIDASLLKELTLVSDVLPGIGELRLVNGATLHYEKCPRCRLHYHHTHLVNQQCGRCNEVENV